jgi:hypothetical protein
LDAKTLAEYGTDYANPPAVWGRLGKGEDGRGGFNGRVGEVTSWLESMEVSNGNA